MTYYFQDHPKNKQIKRPRSDEVKAEVAAEEVEMEVEQQEQVQARVDEEEDQIG